MDSGRWGTIEKILDKALELNDDERMAYIEYACNGDDELRQEIEQLLESVQQSKKEHFLEDNIEHNKSLIQSIARKRITDKYIGQKIGVFELTEQIGYSGMSIVFKAERVDGDFNQQVAIKLIRSGLHSDQILQRFKLEKQTLANLSHPNIARLLDGGITADGNPFLVMEYVNGKPIDQYCNDNQLTVDERLKLFKKVCTAVEYAHHNLIIHRDLKAENIYVTNGGIIKVLDFGIAKLMDTNRSTQTPFVTQPGQQMWTPQYASPEQINGQSINTASDVYSLGILLYKLLTNTYPFDFTGKTIAQIQATITTTLPNDLVKGLKSSGSYSKISDYMNTTFKELKKMLSGDLQAIIAKALRKKASHRYHSAKKLLADIENYETNKPVEARRGGGRSHI